jgi:ribonuclease BN (tRNA processing enzyme)
MSAAPSSTGPAKLFRSQSLTPYNEPVRLTVLGTCGAWPEAGRACSGFLVEHGGFRLVLDLGYATLPRLLALCPAGEVDAVVITHGHPDHCVDLQALFRARYFGARPAATIPLYCPPDVVDRVGALEPSEDLRAVFDVHRLPGEHAVGPFRLKSRLLPHHVPNAGVRLVAPDLTLAYTGDSGPSPALAELGRSADLYLMEATRRDGSAGPHLMTAAEAGVWAGRAGARRLMLTHFWPGSDRAAWVAEARRSFPGEVLAAEEGLAVAL